jgi:glycosyltransferase involved in cell wall biosynthesis
MNTPAPAVTIGLPVYNGENYLAGAVESVLGQTYSDWELILADNASTDGTADLCRSYAERDPRIRYIRHRTNRGAQYNHNFVVKRGQGRYFKWMGHDDAMRPGFLARCVPLLDADPTLALVTSGVEIMDRAGNILGVEEYRPGFHERSPHLRLRRFFEGEYFYHTVYGVMRQSMLRHTGLERDWYGSDRMLMIELSLYGSFEIVPDVLLTIREHPGRSVHIVDKKKWNTPQATGVTSPEYWKRVGAGIEMVLHAPMSDLERARCLMEFLRRARHRYRHWLPRLASEVGRMTGRRQLAPEN